MSGKGRALEIEKNLSPISVKRKREIKLTLVYSRKLSCRGRGGGSRIISMGRIVTTKETLAYIEILKSLRDDLIHQHIGNNLRNVFC